MSVAAKSSKSPVRPSSGRVGASLGAWRRLLVERGAVNETKRL
jgi:hypothetical protein